MTPRPTVQPLPAAPGDGLAGAYFEWHRAGELRLLRCGPCSTWIHPPQPSCPKCDAGDLAWQRVAGTGSVFTWTLTHRPFHPMFEAELPYVAAIVTLDEGPRLLTMLRDVDPAQVRPDLRVTVAFEQREGDTAVAIFVPDPDVPEVADG